MKCHNGSPNDDYKGPGLENPHPFAGADNLRCTVCHGGNPLGADRLASHVPPPPEIGDDQFQLNNNTAYFNRLTLTGIDKFPDYIVGGKTYTALDYLQFINPGDLRVVTQGKSCGACHAGHSDVVEHSLLATQDGIFGGALYAIGVDNAVPANQGLYEDTAGDLAFRAVTDPAYVLDPTNIGAVGDMIEFPVFSVRGANGPDDIHNNPDYNSLLLPNDRNADNTVITGSKLANLYHEQIAFTCGDCHLGSAGANNRYGDYRSSGCTACHMRYSLSGRSGTTDPNVNKIEPLDPDDIDPPEQSHVARHLIRTVAKTLPSGQFVTGIDDYTCAGCHQGSNRTVMQYWGIRLDQNADVRDNVQYPLQPVSYKNTNGDTRLFDPVIGNNEFNGRNRNQYLLEEDYDGDGRDDTPPDVHYEAGLGCIDCHGSYDLHGGDAMAADHPIYSRMEQAVAIRCESCHGAVDAYAATQQGLDYEGNTVDLAVDSEGNVLRHVTREAPGTYYLTSRLTGARHYLPQTMDTVVDSGKVNPDDGLPIYTKKASYAMGRADGNASTGLGPLQSGSAPNAFSHADNVSCVACHASWTNNCMGCHLEGDYDLGNNFSNITGQRIVFEEDEADFVYQNPFMFQIGIDTHNKVAPIAPNTDAFFKYRDLNNVDSRRFGFTDRNGGGSNTLTSAFPSMSHNSMMPHSIRGRVTPTKEGPRYCVNCHLTDYSIATYGAAYDVFRTAMAANDFTQLDFNLLAQHFGRNSGNQIDSPFWVHNAAGLGSGLFLFDEFGCPVNPLDDDNDRKGCDNVPPNTVFDLARVYYNMDKLVNPNGFSNGSNNHSMLEPGVGPSLRDGAANPNQAGPLGATLIQKLTDPVNGVVLDSWLDANSTPQGDASNWVN